MGRVTVHVADSVLSCLDAEAHNKSISRSQAVAKAIESFISGVNQANLETHNIKSELCGRQEEVMRLNQEISKLVNQTTEKDQALESMHSNVMRLDEEVKRINYELIQTKSYADQLQHDLEDTQNLQNELAVLKPDLQHKEEEIKQLKIDAELKWRETNQLRAEVSQARRELELARAKADRLQSNLDKIRTEAEQARSAAEILRHEEIHYKQTLSLKDEQIHFLEGHVSQLTQLALPQMTEDEREARKRRWWQFWKRSQTASTS
jgi:chromosome segregation ATPase